LANVALSVLDEHFAEIPGGPQTSTKRRFTRRQKGLPNYRLIRYADDFVILVSGTRAHTEALLPEVATVLSTVGLRLSEEKTLITHIDEGLDFLGWRIQRHHKREPTGTTSITTRPRRHFGPSRPRPRRSAG
jgi:RNA-directed DNA polymerase